MPPLKPVRIYWDSNVFLDYFNKTPGRFADIHAILTDVRASQGRYKIVTSTLAKVEVAYIAAEKIAPEHYPNVESILDAFWADTHLADLIEVSDDVITQARHLIRTAFRNGWRSFRAHDAIHLGTALWATKLIEVVAFQTYNLQDFQKFQGMVPFPIQAPMPRQPSLFC